MGEWWMGEWWHGRMVEWLNGWMVKWWNCNEIRKWFIVNRHDENRHDENIYMCSRTCENCDTLKPDTIRFCLYSDILIDWFSHISCTFKISDPHLTSINTINTLQIICLCEFIKQQQRNLLQVATVQFKGWCFKP